MTDYEMLEERCNYAEARCQLLQEQLDQALMQLEEAISIAVDAANLLCPLEEPEAEVYVIVCDR